MAICEMRRCNEHMRGAICGYQKPKDDGNMLYMYLPLYDRSQYYSTSLWLRANHPIIPLSIQGLHLYFQAGVIFDASGSDEASLVVRTYFSLSLYLKYQNEITQITVLHILTQSD